MHAHVRSFEGDENFNIPAVETEIFARTLGRPSSVDCRLICQAAVEDLTLHCTRTHIYMYMYSTCMTQVKMLLTHVHVHIQGAPPT